MVRIIVSMLASIFIISPVSASVSQMFHLKKLQQHHSAKAQAKASKQVINTESTNFSGQWKGTCADDEGNSDPVSLNISHFGDWFIIEADGENARESYTIGGMLNQSSTSEYENSFSHTAVNWNEDKTKLLIDLVDFEIGHGPIYTSISKVVLSLQNGQLVSDISVGLYEDNEQYALPFVKCTYNKDLG